MRTKACCDPDARSEEIVLAVGGGPATITDADMDLVNHRFLVYSQLGGKGDTFGVLSWRGLVGGPCGRMRCLTLWSRFTLQELTIFPASIAGNLDPWYFTIAPGNSWNTPRMMNFLLIWNACGFARAAIKRNLPCSRNVSEAKSGVDYGFENINQLCKTLKPRFENGAWRGILSWDEL